MLHYRLFFFDGAGRIEEAREFEAEDDETAVRTAEQWRSDLATELWQRDRRVKVWERG